MVSERKVAPHNVKALDLEDSYIPPPKPDSHLFFSMLQKSQPFPQDFGMEAGKNRIQIWPEVCLQAGTE